MLLLLLSLQAFAAPDHVAATWSIGSELGALAVSADGRWIATIETSSDELRVLDTLTWSADTLDAAPCDGLAGLTGVEVAGAQRFYVGCSDGTVRWAEVSDDGIDVSTDEISVGSEAIIGLVAGDETIFALEDGEDSRQLHVITVSDGTVDDGGYYPVEVVQEGYYDLLWTGVDVIVLHGGDNVSLVVGSSGTLSAPERAWSGADCLQGAIGSGPSALFACSDAGVLRYVTTLSSGWAAALTTSDGLDTPNAIAIDESDSDDPYVIVGDDGEAVVYAYDSSTGYPDDSALETIDLDGASLSRLVSTGGYAVASTPGGELWVLTDRPWVEITAQSEDSAISGDTVTIDFTSDTDGDWTLYLGDDSGTELDSGSVSAGETATASFEVSSDVADFIEGNNLLTIYLDPGAGQDGHAGTTLSVDNPPSRVKLSDDDVGYGDEQIVLSWSGVDDEDLGSYRIYISTTEFSSSDYATGGPTFDGQDDLTAIDGWDSAVGAFVISDKAPGEDVSVNLNPLTNGTTYYLGVRAVDTGDQEGKMSRVVSAKPQKTYTLVERTGDDGGMCGTTGRVSALGALVAGLFVLGRRRRVGLVAGVLGGVMVLGASPARAADHDEKPAGNVQLRFGPMWYASSNKIYDQFTKPHDVLWLEFGPSWRGLVEMNLGVGYYNKSGYLLAEDGTQATAQPDQLTSIPFTAALTGRLDLLDEQWVVPTVSFGGDYWLWRERSTSGDTTSSVTGAKGGYHYAFGLQLLLDEFDTKQASLIEARAGIHDTYVVAEYRNQTINGDGGISFTATSVTVGLKLNY